MMKGQREREKWWAVRKRGHGCHAPRVKPAINREVKLLRHSLVHRSLPFARKSLHLSLSRETTVLMEIHQYIYMLFLSSLFLSFPSLSIKILPPRIYHAIPREGETTKERESISNRIPSWRNSRSGQRINDEPIKKR